MNGDAKIRGTGNSVAALLGNGNGNLKLLMNDGLVSRNLMEILGLNVGNFIIGQIFGDDEVRVNCAAANIDRKRRGASANLCLRYRKCGDQYYRHGQYGFGAAGSHHQPGK